MRYDDFYRVNSVDNQPDKTTWPLLYRVVDVDPNTDPTEYDVMMQR